MSNAKYTLKLFCVCVNRIQRFKRFTFRCHILKLIFRSQILNTFARVWNCSKLRKRAPCTKWFYLILILDVISARSRVPTVLRLKHVWFLQILMVGDKCWPTTQLVYESKHRHPFQICDFPKQSQTFTVPIFYLDKCVFVLDVEFFLGWAVETI